MISLLMTSIQRSKAMCPCGILRIILTAPAFLLIVLIVQLSVKPVPFLHQLVFSLLILFFCFIDLSLLLHRFSPSCENIVDWDSCQRQRKGPRRPVDVGFGRTGAKRRPLALDGAKHRKRIIAPAMYAQAPGTGPRCPVDIGFGPTGAKRRPQFIFNRQVEYRSALLRETYADYAAIPYSAAFTSFMHFLSLRFLIFACLLFAYYAFRTAF